MKPAPFTLQRPTSFDEALALLSEHPEETVVLAGGQSLVPLINMRFVMAERVLDLNEVDELDRLEIQDGSLGVGAMTRHRTAELSKLVAEHCPLVAEAEGHVGYVAIRQRGTVGGSIAHADTVAELTCVAVALDATVVLESVRGLREIPASQFFVANLTNAREPDELVVEIRFPVRGEGSHAGFDEFARKVGDFPLVTAAAQLRLEGSTCLQAKVAVGGASPTPVRLPECEALLEGAEFSSQAIEEAAHVATGSVEPVDDPFTASEYRRALVGVTVGRALRKIQERKEEGV